MWLLNTEVFKAVGRATRTKLLCLIEYSDDSFCSFFSDWMRPWILNEWPRTVFDLVALIGPSEPTSDRADLMSSTIVGDYIRGPLAYLRWISDNFYDWSYSTGVFAVVSCLCLAPEVARRPTIGDRPV